ncbi:hypothetical protein HY68_37010 [Streptomyces sp. AcH 505]|uniref:hypothetical protein n=1 Tax=Streptomyces sp. AcH 505 TaxID=352211 RepID=UPI000591FD73|nr:hypothetical protein HY68_37010 [Streptomyces sp. AcH 505]
MADAIPAPVPNPNDPTPNTPATTPSAGLFSTMLTPIGPARPAPTGPDLTTTGTPEAPVDGTSSATYHGTTDADDKTGSSNSSTTEKKGIIRAWFLAGATRWAKGGGTQNKRLDMRKAKASAMQVKETRQVSLNRSGGLFSGGSGASGKGSNSASGKGASKGPGKGPVKGPKNTNGSTNKGPSGRSGNGSGPGRSGGSGGSGAGSGGGSKQPGGGAHKQPKPDSSSKGPKGAGSKGADGKGAAGGGTAPKTPNGSNQKNSGTSAGGKAGPSGQAGSNAKTAPGGGQGPKGDSPKTPKNDGSSDRGRISLRKDPKDPKSDKDSRKQPDPKAGRKTDPKGTTSTPGASTKDTAATKDSNAKPASTDKKNDLTKKTTPDKPPAKGHETPDGTKGKTGKTFSVRDSRETGYRDGTRIGKTTAHVKAYRDGVKDGYSDVTEAAAQEKKRLDKAHADHKKQIEESPLATPRSSADYHQTGAPVPAEPKLTDEEAISTLRWMQTSAAEAGDQEVADKIGKDIDERLERLQPAPAGPQPIKVDRIDGTHLYLGEGSARNTVSRGEVRSLKQFERRLTERALALATVAETTKKLHVHAQNQAGEAQTYLEQAKSIEGGDRLTGKLVRLADKAKAQAADAEQVYKRAVRSADACNAVLTNVSTRYSGMYKAVVDSPETGPAEMAYYKESN